jgi:phosphomannomutase / phosphoglucomutase
MKLGRLKVSKGPASGKTTRQGAVSGSVLGGVLFLVVAGVLLLAGYFAAQGAADREHRSALEREGEATAVLAAGQVAQAVAREQRQLSLLAETPGLTERAVEGDDLSLLQASFPGALRVAVLPAGLDRAQPDATPPLGFALLDMLRAAEQSAQAVAPEVHLLGRENAHLNFVQPIAGDDGIGAHLVVSYPMDWFTQALKLPLDDLGELRLHQGNGAQAELLRVGRGENLASTYSVHVPNADWALHYSPAPVARTFSPLADPRFLGVMGSALLLLALLMAGVIGVLRRGLASDGEQWQLLTETVASGQPVGSVAMRLAENERAAEAILSRLRDRPQQVAAEPELPRSEAAGEARPPEKPAASTATPPEDDLLSGLELVEPEPRAPEPGDSTEEERPVIDPSLFRAYDIRGVMGKTLSEDVARVIGRAIGSEAAARGCAEVVVGYDGRLSSPGLAEALVEGLRATGRQVIVIGRVPTPVSYFATYHLGTGSCVQITGSHNPPDYNGFKVMLGGETLSGDAIQGLYQRIQREDFVEGEGDVRREDVLPAYLDRIAGDITLHRPLKVVVDAGNGVAGEIGPEVLRAIGCEVEELYCEVDGNFPNHHPDPSDPKNLEELISLVRLQEADVGLAFDGDGDRLGVVDASGKIIWADRQMMLYAMDILSRQPGADIIFDVKCSSHLARIISDNAGVPIMWRTGHSLIKAKLKETGAPLAGEMSGHIFFNDRWDGFDDGIYTAARLLEILSMDPRSSTEVFAELPETVSTPELKIHLEEGEPPQVIQRLVAQARFPDARVTTIDGLRVDFPDGWGLVRASNTTPCLVLRFEADTEEALERIQQQFRELLEEARPGIEVGF